MIAALIRDSLARVPDADVRDELDGQACDWARLFGQASLSIAGAGRNPARLDKEMAAMVRLVSEGEALAVRLARVEGYLETAAVIAGVCLSIRGLPPNAPRVPSAPPPTSPAPVSAAAVRRQRIDAAIGEAASG